MSTSRYTVEAAPGIFETYTLRDAQAGSLVEVVPARGALCTRMRARGREVLYLDASTLTDVTKNVRGGVPVLFPIAGKLRDDRYTLPDGRTFSGMKQHGFARNRAFSVRGTETSTRAALTLGLASDEATREHFPYEFDLQLTFALAESALSIEVACANRSEGAMPFHLGFHPYFFVPDAAKGSATVRTSATRAFDNVSKTEEALSPGALDFTKPELDMHLLDHREHDTELRYATAGAPTVTKLSWGDAFNTLVLWTVKSKDFVCVEPWSAPGDALNTRKKLRELAPGEVLHTRFVIEAA